MSGFWARSTRSFTWAHGALVPSDDSEHDTLAARAEPGCAEALLAAGHVALADELTSLRSGDEVRQPFVWRALTSATDVDAVRLRPLPPALASAPHTKTPLDYALALSLRVESTLGPEELVLPRAALAVLLQPLVAGLLVDEGCARDLGTAEPLVLAPLATAMVDPRIDAALEERPLLLTCGAQFVAAWARRGPQAALSRALALRLVAEPTDTLRRVLVHLPLGQEAIDEACTLAVSAPRR